MKSRYMTSCAVAALVSRSLGAFAADQPTQVAAAQDALNTPIEQITVSAELRNESIEQAPLTVQALSGVTLDQLNITTFDDLLKYTPNVTYGNNGPGQGEIIMRGLSNGFRGNQSSGTIANFPNVAVYLDEQSMQFPARNADIYMVDMERIEVLEGPQGTLFGGGAEAGAVRYITNRPKIDTYEANAQGMYGFTSGGAPNNALNLMLNIPVVDNKIAVRAVIYNERQGGYIDNVPSTFTRNNNDLGNFYFNVKPANGLCPNKQPAGSAGLCALPQQDAPQINNYAVAQKDFNPVNYTGGRLSLLYDINPDWNFLITESLQNLDAQGLSVEYPTGSDFQPLQPLQVTAFTPSWNKDDYVNSAWTLNGVISDLGLKAIYTGGYTVRRINEQMDYANYSRSVGGMYYECTGGSTGWGNQTPMCYSPAGYWHDNIRSTHLSNEARLATPDDWRLRAIGGAYYENFRIFDVMNFNYKTIPACTATNLTIALSGGPVCVADVTTAPGSTANNPGVRGDSTAFGEDTQRGYDQLAFFGSADFDIIPGVLTITGGTRWYQYKEFEVGSQYATDTGCLNVPNGQCSGGLVNIDAAHDRTTYHGFKSRAVLTWNVNADTMTYALFSQGFRPGGFNRSVSAVAPDATGAKQFEKPNSYAPDSLNNYEIGLKTQLFDHLLTVNLSAYYMQWQSVQFLFFNPTELGNTTFGVNGPDYDVKGAELQFTARPVEGVTISGAGTYNDATQSTSPCLVDNIQGTAAFGQCITTINQKGVGVVPFANPFGTIGSTPAFSPKFQGNMRLRYDYPIANLLGFVSGGFSYMGKMYNQPATYTSGDGVLIPNTTFLRYLQPAYTTFDASIGITNGMWRAEIFGQNLGDSHASTFTSSAQFIKSEVPLRPRVFGLKIEVSY
ncbi:MAG: TonB-dependent receptor [Alphaproteobacteria bacterium]|nr:TonB-dependent receptor [Alphaproteobacteria bacterium]